MKKTEVFNGMQN